MNGDLPWVILLSVVAVVGPFVLVLMVAALFDDNEFVQKP